MPDLSERTSIRILTFKWKRFVPRNVLGSLPWFLRFSILVSETQGSQQIRYPFTDGMDEAQYTSKSHVYSVSLSQWHTAHMCLSLEI